jgi:hypothetical protein
MGWQTAPALILIVGIFGGSMVLRTTIQDVYYDKPKPVDPDYFTKAMMLRDRMLAEHDKAQSGEQSAARGPAARPRADGGDRIACERDCTPYSDVRCPRADSRRRLLVR